MNCTVIGIEGILASGKSTLKMLKMLKMLKNEFQEIENLYFFDEPVDLFQNYKTLDGSNIDPLKIFYKDTSINAFAFQMYVLMCYEHLL